VDVSPVRLRAALLDGTGASTSEPVELLASPERVMGFDVAPNGTGELLIAWKAADANPGAGGGKIAVVRLSQSGAITPVDVPEEAADAGVPTLLLDPAQPRGWMALGGDGDETALLAMLPTGQLQGPLHAEPVLGRGSALAVVGQELLLGRPRGRGVQFERVHCGAEPLPPQVEPEVEDGSAEASPPLEEEQP
jgi:hypothetical protein